MKRALLLMLLAGSVSAANLQKGMTQSQVQQLYGRPNEVEVSDSGVRWTYTKGFTKMLLNPFAQPTITIIYFNRSGRVKAYSQDN